MPVSSIVRSLALAATLLFVLSPLQARSAPRENPTFVRLVDASPDAGLDWNWPKKTERRNVEITPSVHDVLAQKQAGSHTSVWNANEWDYRNILRIRRWLIGLAA
jgi:hypothetical protein